jgi:hypothetical protein
MAIKLLKLIFPQGVTGVVYTNNSTSFILIVQISLSFPSGNGVIYIQDEKGNAVGDLAKVTSFGASGSISGSDTFSSNNSTTTGITNTTLSRNDSISLGEYMFQFYRKGLLAQGYSLNAYQVTVYGFLALEADTLEELRGFL